MPEGDTLFKTATRLRPALVGGQLTRFEAPRMRGRGPSLGEQIEGVEARGKNLLVHFRGGLTLRTHLRMTGSWHLYRERERWRKPAYLARAVLGVDSGWVAVCFQAPVVETFHRAGSEPDGLAGLGPDLCRPEASSEDVVASVLARTVRFATAGTTLADALLDQRIAAGVGNVYKSEVCFAVGIHPATPVAQLGDEDRRAVWAMAARQLQANLDSPVRRTHPAGLAVYGRGGQPCLRCQTPIASSRHGDLARVTYWCPRCQPENRL